MKRVLNNRRIRIVFYLVIGSVYIISTLSNLSLALRQSPSTIGLFAMTIIIFVVNLLYAACAKLKRAHLMALRLNRLSIIQVIVALMVLAAPNIPALLTTLISINFLALMLIIPTIMWAYGLTYIMPLEKAIALFILLKVLELMIYFIRFINRERLNHKQQSS